MIPSPVKLESVSERRVLYLSFLEFLKSEDLAVVGSLTVNVLVVPETVRSNDFASGRVFIRPRNLFGETVSVVEVDELLRLN